MRPLHDRLCVLEEQWREADERFAVAMNAGTARLDLAIVQTQVWAEHARVLARELAVAPALRVGLVREGVWTAREAFESCLRHPGSACRHWIELLPLLSDEAVDALVEHTRDPRWQRQDFEHVGVWVSRTGGGERLLVELCARLLERGEVVRARELFDRIEHLGARIDALALLRDALGDAFADTRADLLARSRALDPIRRHYALCDLGRLFPPSDALACVEDGIAGLPAGHDWTHAPGGLMLMLLADPVFEALDRDGLREQLVAWADREGDRLQASLTDDHRDRLAVARGRPAEALSARTRLPDDAFDEAARGNAWPLVCNYEAIPDARLGLAIEHVRAAVEREPSHPWPVSVLLRLAGRTGDALALACVTEHVEAVEWHRYSSPEPVWSHADFSLLPSETRQRLLTTAVDRLRVEAKPRLDSDAYLLAQQLDAGAAAREDASGLGARWLAGARFGAAPTDAWRRWEIAGQLWGRPGLIALRELVAGGESRS